VWAMTRKPRWFTIVQMAAVELCVRIWGIGALSVVGPNKMATMIVPGAKATEQVGRSLRSRAISVPHQLANEPI
jgi:hypothetical protein